MKQSIDELNRMIEFTESTIFQKQKIANVIKDIDVYLKRIHDSCDFVTSESSKEEYIYQTERDEISKYMDDLDSEKQTLWVMAAILLEAQEQSQSLLEKIQENRQEIENITAIISERKHEQEELEIMMSHLPQVMNRSHNHD